MTGFFFAAADELDRQADGDEASTRLRKIIASLNADNPDDLAVLRHIISRLRAGIRFLEAKGGGES